MTCPYLRYRSSDENHEFDHERPYCTATASFVSPMRADVCNDRHDFEHVADCDVYRRRSERAAVEGVADATADAESGALD